MSEENAIHLMQADVAARLAADEYFSDITVLLETQGDIQNGIDRALKVLTSKGGKIGVAAVVATVNANVDSPNLQGPLFNDSSMEVVIFENPTFNDGDNGTGKPAVDIAVRVLQIIHHYIPAGLGTTVLAAPDALRSMGEVQPGTIAYRAKVLFQADGQVRGKVVTPTISPTSGSAPQEVTLACPTAAALIYYTLDGTYPAAGNGTLYTVPFTVSEAALLRVVAHKSGSVASNAAAVEYS